MKGQNSLQSQIKRAKSLLEQPNPKPGEALILLSSLAKGPNAPWSVLYYIGLAYLLKEDPESALTWLHKSIEAGNSKSVTYHLISTCHYYRGGFEKAEQFEKQALNGENFYAGWMHLGAIYRAQAKLKEALDCYKRAAEIEPENTDITRQIAEIYRNNGRLNKALELFRYTTDATNEKSLSAHASIAQILIKREQFEEAEKHLQTILEERPHHKPTQITLSDLFRKKGNYKKALHICEKILEKDPASKARLNYALCCQELGRFDEAERNYKRVLENHPDLYSALSNYLMCIHYNPKQTREQIFEAHKQWDWHFAPENNPERPVPAVKEKEKKLRVGFLSGGFQRHPVGWMITRGLEHLSKDQFEIYCYTTDNAYDEITDRISATADQWQSVIGYNDEVVARMIREDEIDILVELSGHAAGNRLRAIAREPAPIIVKWVGGLFNTTGLQAVDFLITDQYETPTGEEPFYTEKLVRMPDDYICYLPPSYAPDVGSLPAKENGHVTFGCFNNPAKINKQILLHWAEIMKRVPDSQLMLKSKQYDTTMLRKRIITHMKNAGIQEKRIIFRGETVHKDHISQYNKIDIAFDPWPYSGGLTTCEALWMGVPVISKPGPTFAGRHSATHLTNAGFGEWVVDTWKQYVQKTVALADDIDHLSGLRASLREQVADSPLCDGRRFGAHLSVALREIWNQRVEGYQNGNSDWQDHIRLEPLSEEGIEEVTVARRTKKSGAELTDKRVKGSLKIDNSQHVISANPDSTMKAKNQSIEAPNVIGKTDSGESRSPLSPYMNEKGVFKIETKDEITICTPADLNVLTCYVLLEQEQWFESEIAFVREYLRPGMQVVDIGAGFGVYTFPMAKITGSQGMVYAFEPGDICRNHLKMGKAENGFENLKIVGQAAGEQTRTTRFRIAETPELNRAGQEGSKEINQITLDEWWQSTGKTHIDFIKLDVNGNENNVLAGAQKLLLENSPIIQFSIGEATNSDNQNVIEKLEEYGYHIYEYVPRLKLLTPHAPQQQDIYLMNLIAINKDRLEGFKKAGWFYDEDVAIDDVEKDYWKSVLLDQPWTRPVFSSLEQISGKKPPEDYLQALSYLCFAKKNDLNKAHNRLTRSRKAKLILEAVQILTSLYNDGGNELPIVLTLVRGLNLLGRRGEAIQVMKTLIETFDFSRDDLDLKLPFLLPLPEQDQSAIRINFNKWLTVRVVEAWLLLKNITSFFSGEKELKMLDLLEGNQESTISIQKKNILVNLLKGGELRAGLTEDSRRNDWFWSRFKGITGPDEPNLNETMSALSMGADTPSRIIQAEVNYKDANGQDSILVKIPEKEVFRLKNIFNDAEYALPDGMDIKDDGIIVDVGANVGAFALYAKKWNRKAAIHCFEPNPQVFPLLESNTKGFENISKNFLALGDHDGQLTLSQHPVNTGESSTSHKVKGGTTLKVEVKHAGEALKREGIRQIDVLKVDTEGAEVAILRGLKAFLPYTKVAMLEYHTEVARREIDKILVDFQLYSAEVQKLWGIGTVKYINKKLLK